ncbi:NAD-dependent epimerase/dehydratase family protein [Paenibacillus sp. IHBB 3054]|uniref:NAD-dependent epimerase/dehydratase family protein n=1 Tax=Paenibacillus sp. IHBB 3054 TaxID=3425689 RepID=UPI003F671A13
MRVLITGENSYVGHKFSEWVKQWPDKYHTSFVSVKDEDWRKKDFSEYDIVFHVAAIVHKKEQVDMENLYYKVNTELTVELADKAKKSGIRQFVFMSSFSVYGLEGSLEKNIEIKRDTECAPKTFYGKSKLKAEEKLEQLNDESFKVAIIRAPMIYGPNCPGNYAALRDIVMKIPVFPRIENKRSMIYIDNLSEFLRFIIENNEAGVFLPQNKNFISTLNLVQLIAQENSRDIYLSKIFAYFIKTLAKRMKTLNKAFGNLTCDMELSNYKDFEYCLVDLPESIKLCEQ